MDGFALISRLLPTQTDFRQLAAEAKTVYIGECIGWEAAKLLCRVDAVRKLIT